MTLTPEQRKAIQDAMTILAQVPGYAGAAVVLALDRYERVGVFKHATINDEFIDRALATIITTRAAQRTPIILPASAGLPPPGRKNGSG